MRFRMRYVLIGLLIIALLIAVPVIVMTMRFTREYSKLQISEVAISSVASGVYRGLCDVGPVAAEVTRTRGPANIVAKWPSTSSMKVRISRRPTAGPPAR